MKYDFSKALVNQQRKPMTVSDESTTPWTAQIALGAAVLVETSENAKTKLERFALWLKLNDHVDASAIQDAVGPSPTDYTSAEVSALTTAAMTYPALFAGQLVQILDQK